TVANNNDFFILSVAKECYVGRDKHIEQVDLVPIDIWDFVEAVVTIEVITRAWNRKILVHCCAGQSRAPTFIGAWYIYHGMSVDEYLKQFNITLNPIMVENLRRWENWLIGMRDVLRYYMVQFEAANAEPNDYKPAYEMALSRLNVLRKYLDSGNVLLIGGTKPEYDAFSQYYNVDVINVNIFRKVGKFVLFEYYNPGKKYDAIAAFDIFEHTLSPFATIAKAREVLKDDGLLYFSSPTINDPNQHIPWHTSLMHKEEWYYLLDYFSFDRVYEENDPYRITGIWRKGKIKKYESYMKLLKLKD
ncbi:MAG: dual specificity protein phosphatase family protein, partial [Sulfolobus sp.]|nr:dual specificity protein phosphatase family protein [Sulfolobus sp.]